MIAEPAKRIADVDVSRWPLMLTASAPASHSALVTNWRSLAMTLPSAASSPPVSAASSASAPGASSRVSVKPGPCSGHRADRGGEVAAAGR